MHSEPAPGSSPEAQAAGRISAQAASRYTPTWVITLVLAVLCSVATAGVAWLCFSPDYLAYALLRIAGETPKLVFDTAENRGRSDFEIYKRTQKELMRSRFVLNAALRSPDIERLPAVREEDDAVSWLEKHINIDFPGEAEIMRVSFSHKNAETAAAIANAVEKAYMQQVVDVERIHRMERLESLEKLLNNSEDKMHAKQADLKRLADRLGTGDGNALTSKQQITLQHFATLQNEHTKIQFELMRAKHTLAALEEASNSEIAMDAPVEPEKDRRNLRLKKAVLMAQEKQMNEEVKKFEKEAESIGRSSIDVEMMRTDLKQIEKMSNDLGREIEWLRVELRSPSRVTHVLSADVPISRDMTEAIGTTSILAVFGFLLPFVAVSLWKSHVQALVSESPTRHSREVTRNEAIDAIERLGELKVKGILSEDEFASKKAELLAGI
jgi:capsular polysaccharide biosynthesis protein